MNQLLPAALAVVLACLEPQAPNPAVVPAPRTDEGILARQAEVVRRAKTTAKAAVVFVGDSITQGWEDGGRDAWQKHFAALGALNLGVSGDRTEHVLWRLREAPLTHLEPKFVVLLIGTNNLGHGTSNAEQTLAGVQAVIALLREQVPHAVLLVHEIFPRGERMNPMRGDIAQVNQVLRGEAGPTTRVLAIGDRWVRADGTIGKDIMPDSLHLSPKGYEQWAAALAPEFGDGPITVGPEYTVDPDLTDKGNPKGKQFEFTLALAESRTFKGDDKTLEPDKKPVNARRTITVYVPAAYVDGAQAPYLVIHDGPGPLGLVRNALDNLTISGDPQRKLPAFVAIAVQNGGDDGKNSERGLEYDTMSDRLARFIAEEVVPAVRARAEIKAAYPRFALSDDPWDHAVMGCSSGGAAALSMGWFRPDLFRRIVAYSGTFVDQQDDDAPEEQQFPLGAWEYHSGMKLIESSERKPLRIFTHVSEHDIRENDAEETHHNWVMAGQRTAAALQAKGYEQRFVFSLGTGHCDGKVFQQTLADTLVWVWRGHRAY